MYPQYMFEQKYENSQKNSTENYHIYSREKNRCILHGHVFVMTTIDDGQRLEISDITNKVNAMIPKQHFRH